MTARVGAAFVAWTLALAMLCVALPARAHGLDPIGISLVEARDGTVRVRIDRPVATGDVIVVQLPDGCSLERSSAHPDGVRMVEEHTYACSHSLAERDVTITGLETAKLDGVFRSEDREGFVHRAVVTADHPSVRLPQRPSKLSTLTQYVLLGARHLMGGFDHLLFIVGIVIVTAKGWRRPALALTAFTAGHSLTLSAAALGVLAFPPAVAEVGIAATLVWLAIAVVRGEKERAPLRLWIVSFAIGLVHGLGFASALAEAGLPPNDVPLALFGFNLGIELVQLGLVALLLGLAAVTAKLSWIRREDGRRWLGHAMGAVAVMWCIERLVGA